MITQLELVEIFNAASYFNSWMALYVNRNNATYVDSSGVEHVPKNTKKFSKNKNTIANIYKMQEHTSVMCGCFFITIINFILKVKSLLDYLNLFPQIYFLI